MNKLIRPWTLFFALLLLCGCEEKTQINSYQVPKETRQILVKIPISSARTAKAEPSRMLALMIRHGDDAWFFKAVGPIAAISEIAEAFDELSTTIRFADNQAVPSWDLPDGWTQELSPGGMRYATINADGVDLSVTKLAIRGSNYDDYVVSNVNRWRQQLQLPKIALESLPKNSKRTEINGLDVIKIDISGVSSGSTMAPFAGGGAPTRRQNSDAPPKTKDPDLPESWEVGSGSSMRLATYNVRKGDAAAEVTVIPLGPAAGDLASNVNRWADQIGMEHPSEQQLQQMVTSITVDQTESQYVSLIDENAKEAALVVIVPKQDRTWFIKMKGERSLVEAEKSNFEAYATSIDLP